MTRPCFLVVDVEFPGSISTRKLVIETAKFNVITAYNAEEGIETLRRFPNVDGVVIDAITDDMPCRELIDKLRAIRDDIVVVVASPESEPTCGEGVLYVESFDPKSLLALLQNLRKQEKKEIKEREEFIQDKR